VAARVGLDKTDVLDAAARIVDEQGIEALTLSRLAERLGVRSQSLYAHVDGLAGLRRDLELMAFGMLTVQLRRAAMAKAGKDALLALMETSAAFTEEHPGLARLVSWNRHDPTDEVMFDALNMVGEPFQALLSSYGLVGDELAHWYRIMWASLQGFLSLQAAGLLMATVDQGESLHLLMELFADGLERVRTTPAPEERTGS
jgi:AcrR family transcriptional regulator